RNAAIASSVVTVRKRSPTDGAPQTRLPGGSTAAATVGYVAAGDNPARVSRGVRRGSASVSASATNGRTATTSNTAVRPCASASSPSSGAPTPPSPIDSPIVTPADTPSRPGRYSWPITIVTANVAIVAAPASAANPIATIGPDTMNPTTSGGITSIEPTSTVRRPNRSASGPPVRVPTAPPNSIALSATLPSALPVCRTFS